MVTNFLYSAAVMSSMDSSLLSGASYITHNLYSETLEKPLQRVKCFTKVGPVQVMRFSIVLLGVLATTLSLATNSVYDLWVLAGDLGYVIVFPHFLASVHFPELVNRNGALVAVAFGTVLRLSIGEVLFGIPPLFALTFLPIKTSIMLATLTTLLTASHFFGRQRYGQREVVDQH